METTVTEDLEAISIGDLLSSKLILINDSVNSFDWVIQCLVVILGHSPLQAEQCVLITHYKGSCVIKEGSFEELKECRNKLINVKLNAIIK